MNALKFGCVSPKGGPGKSFLSCCLSASLSQHGYDTGLYDADSTNQHAFTWTQLREQILPPTPQNDEGASIEWMSHRATPLPAVTGYAIAKEVDFAKDIQALSKQKQALVIDGRPSMGSLTTEIIQVSDFIVVPVYPGAFDMLSIMDFMKYYENACFYTRQEIPGCFVLNRLDLDSHFVRDVRKILADYPLPTLENTLRTRADYGRSLLFGLGPSDLKTSMRNANQQKIFRDAGTARNEWGRVFTEIIELSNKKLKK